MVRTVHSKNIYMFLQLADSNGTQIGFHYKVLWLLFYKVNLPVNKDAVHQGTVPT